MSTTLRIALLIIAIFTVFWIIIKIRKNHFRPEDTLFWFCFAILMGVLGLFPQVISYCAGLLGIMSPANFLYLLIIALLSEKIFTLSAAVSKLQGQIELMSAEVALRTRHYKDDDDTDK